MIKLGRAIKTAVEATGLAKHPLEDDLSFVYGTIFTTQLQRGSRLRNVCVFADGEVDRSPTGTGVSGRAAIEYARGQTGIGETIAVESILGTEFEVSVLEQVEYGGFEAVIPEVRGNAFVTGINRFVFDPDDELSDGFFLR